MRLIVLILAAAACTPGMRPPDDPGLDFAGPIRSRDIGEGGRVYIELCSACHRGRVNPRGYHWSPAQMRHQIRRGNEIMPPLPRELVSDEQVEAVLAYLVVSGALEGVLPPEEIEAADASQDPVFDEAAFEEGEDEFADDEFADEPSGDAVVPEDVTVDPESESAQGLDPPQ
jgi:hypothetical protein